MHHLDRNAHREWAQTIGGSRRPPPKRNTGPNALALAGALLVLAMLAGWLLR